MNSHAIIPPKTFISTEIYLFLYSLLKSIFIDNLKINKKKSNRLEQLIKIIKDKYNIELKIEYSKQNFENIIKFVKTQNIIYAGEILENIILIIFTSIMEIPQNETINKYIYYNLQTVYGIKNYIKEKQIEQISIIQNFILYNKLFPKELRNKDIFFQPYEIIPTDLEYFITLIYKLKFDSINNIFRGKEKSYNDTSYNLYKYSLKNPNSTENKERIKNSIIEFEYSLNIICKNYKKNNTENNLTSIISYFFFALFINYQTINSRLMNYNRKLENCAALEYEYNLRGSSMKPYYAILLSSPMRQDNRIIKISMEENDLGELGMLELGKTIVFNPNIKALNYNKNRLYSFYFYYLNKGSKIFDNNSIEEINVNNNFLKDNIDDYLCDILKKCKKLKKINISNNKIGSGISKFLSYLKLLYRQKKSKIEKLNINKCNLDSFSLFELSECLKCKFCKLKCLYLNINYLNDYNIEPLLNAIKKNNSLKEVYLGRNFIGNNSIEKIGKIITQSNNSIDIIYLNQNEINNNDNLLKLISKTKIIYSKEEDKNKVIIDLDKNKILKNLDLSKNNIFFTNKSQILLFKKIINDSYLLCLDYSVILKDFKNQKYLEYKNEIQSLKIELNSISDKRKKLFIYLDNKYSNIFKQFTDNKQLNNILSEAIKQNNIFTIFENIEKLISNELLEIIGIKEKYLLDDNNYNMVNNLIKYMLLYKVNGGIMNNWLKGSNKCLIII